MSCSHGFSGLANAVLNELNYPSGLGIVNIISWFKYNLGNLNSVINQSYVLSGDNANPPLGPNESGIFQQMYLCKYYNSQIQANLGAAAYDWSELREGDSQIRRVSRNEVAKTYMQLSNSCKETLQYMITAYKLNSAVPYSLQADQEDVIKIDRV